MEESKAYLRRGGLMATTCTHRNQIKNVKPNSKGCAECIEQAQDALSINHGRHTIKIGADITFLAVTAQIPFNNRGSIEYALGGGFTSLGNFVDDFTGGTPGTISRAFGNPTITPNATIYAPYVQ